MRKHKRSKFHILLYLIVSAFILMVGSAVILTAYCYTLSNHIENRFSGRKWSIPSKVYSDSLLLYPGQHFPQNSLLDKLKRLGYRQVSAMPEKMGDYKHKKDLLMVYLHQLNTPNQQRKGFIVRIAFQGGRIQSIKNMNENKVISLLEIEPEEIMLFFGPERERRELVSINQVPDHVIDAVLTAEDSRFYTHKGMDYRGILRAFIVNLRHVAIKQGGSTITQQLAKNYFLTPERSYVRKFKELCMSITMELMYEKDEILEIYLNEIYFGQKGSTAVNGIGEASIFYFDKPVSQLTVAEAAAIAGLIRGPNRYSPYVNLKRCRNRRNQVLKSMYENNLISDMQFHSAMIEPLEPAGYLSYGKKAPYFMDYLKEQLKTLYSSEDLTSLGLSIYTTLDTEVQNAAETALENGLRRLENLNPDLSEANLQGVVIVMQPQTGYILALVGGRDYNISQFNRAVHARRQPGSAFKPFVYTASLDEFTPSSLLSNIPKTYEFDGKVWEPKNYSEFPKDFVRMRTALAQSINLATVDLAMSTGLDKISETSKKFGFSTLETIYPSISLGAMPVIPLELARAYCPFAANGMLPFPLSLKEVADEQNQTLQMHHMTGERVISPAKAFIVNSMLQSVVEEGTAASLKSRGVTYPVAAKTGTTNDYRDAWFIGFTPDILALVWVGCDDGSTIKASGSSAALPIWADLMSRLPQHISKNGFTRPSGVVKKVICSETGKPAVKNRCPEPLEEFFLSNKAPDEICRKHQTHNPFRQVLDEFKSIFNP